MGRIHHLVGTYSGSDGIRLYVNSVQVQAVAGGGFGWRPTTDPLNIFADGAADDSFNGVIDEVSVYEVVLTPAQILARYKLGVQPRIAMPSSASATGSLSTSCAREPRILGLRRHGQRNPCSTGTHTCSAEFQ